MGSGRTRRWTDSAAIARATTPSSSALENAPSTSIFQVDVRAHVPPVGQQREGARDPAARDLRDHRGRRDGHDDPQPPLARDVARVERVLVAEGGEVVDRHRR